MRILLVLIAVSAAAIVGAAFYFRMAPMPPDVWHVDPDVAALPTTPNYELLVEEDAPRLPGTPEQVAVALDIVATSEGAVLIAGSPAEGFMTYVARCRFFGFPDAISMRLHAEGEDTRVDIFSRSRFGQSDLGVNAARVERWMSKAGAQAQAGQGS